MTIPKIKVVVYFVQDEREMPICETAEKSFPVVHPLSEVVEFVEQQMSGHWKVDSYVLRMEWCDD